MVAGRVSHWLGSLWSKVWAQFSIHTLARDLLASEPACRLMQDTQRKEGGMGHTEKRRRHGTHREGEQTEKGVPAACSC